MMQMSNTSEMVLNHSCASACAVGISWQFPFRSLLRELRGVCGLPHGFVPTVRARGIMSGMRPALWKHILHGLEASLERSRQSMAPVGTFTGIL